METFEVIKKHISNYIEEIKDSIIYKIILLIAVAALSLIFIFLTIIFIKEFNPNLNPNFSFVVGEFLAILLAFLFLLFSNTSLDKYLILILTVVIIAILSYIFFKKIEIKPGFLSDIMIFEISIIAFLIPLIFNIASWISKKYNSSTIIFGYDTVLLVFLLSSLVIMIIAILQLISNFSKPQSYYIIGFIFSLFLITFFFIEYIIIQTVYLVINFEKVIDTLYQKAERYFKSLNKESPKLSDLRNSLQQLKENKSNLADKTKKELKISKTKKKINNLKLKISKIQRGFNEAIEGTRTILVYEIKKRRNEELVIRKLKKIEDLVNKIKIFEMQCDYCYESKRVLINQIINIYNVAVELQNINITIYACDYINWIKNQLKEKEEKPSSYGDPLLRRMIKEEALLCQRKKH